jgi:CIC family chloride channel protein
VLLQRTGHYYVEGVGYATIMDVLGGALSDPWFLLLLAALKLVATALSIGSGASGGVFSPALFIGATAGGAVGVIVTQLAPGMGLGVPAFALAGMAGMVGGTTGAVLTAIVMITELTDDTAILLPLIITAAAAWWTRRAVMAESIYTMKLLARGHAVPEGLQAPVLPVLRVADAMTQEPFRIEAAPDGHIAAVSDAEGRALRFVTSWPREGLLQAATRMHDAGAEVILVLPTVQSRVTPEAVIGAVTQAALVGQLKSELERHR